MPVAVEPSSYTAQVWLLLIDNILNGLLADNRGARRQCGERHSLNAMQHQALPCEKKLADWVRGER